MSGRVAVIAVHGVADQEPFATARATADLLKCELGDQVTEFVEERLRIEVRPLELSPPNTPAQTSEVPQQIEIATMPAGRLNSTKWKAGVELRCDTPPEVTDEEKLKNDSMPTGDVSQKVFMARSHGVSQIALTLPAETRQEAAETDENDPDTILNASRVASVQYFEAQLREYRQQPADAFYETVRLTSTTKNHDTQVDVHEMYWGDLSRVQIGIFRAVEELYYVLFAVCNIGRMELDRSRSLFTGWPWKCLRFFEGFAERVLTLFVPLGNACLLLLMVFTLPHLVPDEIAGAPTFPALVGFGAGLVIAAIVFVSCFIRRPPKRTTWLLVIGGLVGSLVGYVIGLLPNPTRHCVLSVLLWAICAAVLMGLAYKFNNRQPGAWRVSWILALLVLIAVGWEAWRRSEQVTYWALDIGLATAEWILLGLMLVWLAYLGAAALCSILGYFAVCHERQSPLRLKTAKRLVWTANLAILVPGMLFIVLNLGIWQALYTGSGYVLPKLIPAALSHKPAGPYANWLKSLVELENVMPSCEQIGMNAVTNAAETKAQAEDFSIPADRVPSLLLRNSALPLIVVLVPLVLMLLATAWLLLPAILAEGATAHDPNHVCAQKLGNNLSYAWRGMRCWAEPFVRWQLFLLIFICFAVFRSDRVPSFNALKVWLFEWSETVLTAVGWLFVLLATGAINYMGLRSVIDVAADVANWLRMHPRDNNPTSRISARYVSLLRHIAHREDANGNQYYDRVVIFAHSLGSSITVDLLQFLKSHSSRNGFGALTNGTPQFRQPVSLFTHGCPLRQLLGLRLPLTYGWAWHNSNDWDHNEEPAGEELLGVKNWTNAYCSGDYVGRHLWHNDVDDLPWNDTRKRNDDALGAGRETIPRVELCVGAGGHTHYWDPNPREPFAPSSKIAEELRKLIGFS